jgi:hypothetical protein
MILSPRGDGLTYWDCCGAFDFARFAALLARIAHAFRSAQRPTLLSDREPISTTIGARDSSPHSVHRIFAAFAGVAVVEIIGSPGSSRTCFRRPEGAARRLRV